MRYTICSQCRSLFAYGRLTCPECRTRHNRENAERIKLCPRDGTPMPVGSRFCPVCKLRMGGFYVPLWAWLVLLIIASFANTLFLANIHHYVYTTFRQTSCVIHAVSIDEHSDKSGTTYSILWNYTVIGDYGQQIYSGQDRMGLGNYDLQDEAAQVVTRYQIGATYSCWYSSVAFLNRTLLFLPDEASSTGFIAFGLLGTFVLLSAVGMCIIWMIWYPWRTFKYGRSTVGKVIRRETERDRYGFRTYYNIIAFRTKTKPPLSFQKRMWADFRKRERVTIFYDPLHPEQTARIDYLTLWEMRFWIAGGLLCILVVLGLLGALIVMAFTFG